MFCPYRSMSDGLDTRDSYCYAVCGCSRELVVSALLRSWETFPSESLSSSDAAVMSPYLRYSGFGTKTALQWSHTAWSDVGAGTVIV